MSGDAKRLAHLVSSVLLLQWIRWILCVVETDDLDWILGDVVLPVVHAQMVGKGADLEGLGPRWWAVALPIGVEAHDLLEAAGACQKTRRADEYVPQAALVPK